MSNAKRSVAGYPFLAFGAPTAGAAIIETVGSDVKVFVSSLIGGMEALRAAAVEAVTLLGHEPITAETFAADPSSPQVACLSGVRGADLVVLILDARYGAIQKGSGLSATHEEYRAAKGSKPVLVFVRGAVEREPEQDAFVGEVEGWERGHFRATFASPENLRNEVAKAVHRWELSTAVAPVDAAEMLLRANDAIAQNRSSGHDRPDSVLLSVAIAGGPVQQILRPTEIEEPDFARSILQQAMFGEVPIFSLSHGSETKVSGGRLTLLQKRGSSVSIDESGTIVLVQALTGVERGYGVIIEEEISEKLRVALAFGAWLLEAADSSQRLSRIAPVAQLPMEGYSAWRTRSEHDRSPDSITYGHGFRERVEGPVHLQPPDRARAALTFERDRIAEDLLVLLRRQFKQ